MKIQLKYFKSGQSGGAEVALWSLSNMENPIYSSSLRGSGSCVVMEYKWTRTGSAILQDHSFMVFDPRASSSPIKEGRGPNGSRGSRLAWLNEDEYIVTTGFDQLSEFIN